MENNFLIFITIIFLVLYFPAADWLVLVDFSAEEADR